MIHRKHRVILDKRRSRADPGSIIEHSRPLMMDPGTPLRFGQDDGVFPFEIKDI